MGKVSQLSVFFPAYNEEANIKATVTRAASILPQVAEKWEIIVVNDGSTDRTGQVVKQLMKKPFDQTQGKLRMITHDPNRGYGEALKSGLYGARYDWIAFTDSDGQFDFGEITKFLEKRSQAQLAIGYRVNRQDPLTRKLFGVVWTGLSNLLLGIRVKDADCGFKLIKKEVIDTIPRLLSSRGAMVSPELLAKAKKAGFQILEVGVQHYPRQEGKQTGASLKVIVNSFFDLGKLWWQLK